MSKTSFKSRALGVIAATAMAAVMTVGGVTAAQASPGSGGAQLNGDVSPTACKTVSGGEWCYGTTSAGTKKRCYSNYKHNSRYHSATATMANATSTKYANAGYWAKASVKAGYGHTCHAYYNSNA
ncbi:lactococcin 972 family bacteriocin [Stackebrandtia endophytica]|uniref:Lactococcin 972 family bacteriocin n=1 Tax=Stackebrandtia endophytica TaxID=1496996 RepID=A0A543AUK5_9ACTN|nr:lactococcin 972 family bacteriocin [Stackebrandtia endophytica]TQL76268.1 lactococcin 972 family bacteriocin [Stackebrandtia endophytica]